jgi:iron complex outermembrane receptor protein
LRANYTHILESKIQEFPEDPVDKQYRDDKQNFELRHRFNSSLGWQMGDWNTVFTAYQRGSVPNWGETDRLDETWTYNMSVAWAVTDNIVLSVLGNNITNERPPKDPSFDTWPGFYRGTFDAVGAEYWAQIDWTFGRN